jgi:hypothetical protein
MCYLRVHLLNIEENEGEREKEKKIEFEIENFLSINHPGESTRIEYGFLVVP